MTDCARGLNGKIIMIPPHQFSISFLTDDLGYGVGARYDGSIGGSKAVGSCSNISDIGSWPAWYRDDIRGFIEAQLDTYEAVTNGWVFWNFKTESSGEWDLFRLLDAGIFPQPLSARKFPPVCSNL